MAAVAQKAASSATRQLNAVVVSAGLMQKTVKVRIGGQKFDSHIKKQFKAPASLLVHDPNDSLRQGDVISIAPGWRASKHVRHVVSRIIAPFGEPIESRPPVPSEEERVAEREMKKKKKDERRRGKRLDAKQSSEEVEGHEVRDAVQEGDR